MPLDASSAGRTYPPTPPYEVGVEKIREFADAIGDTNPVYRDRDAAKDAGHPDVVAPPTFAFVLTFQASRQVIDDPELGIDYSRVVHGEQRFVHTRPVRAGDALTTTVTIDAVRSAGGHDMVTTRSDVSTVDGEPVVTAYSTLVVRGAGAVEEPA
jgi:acyl dehydratase